MSIVQNGASPCDGGRHRYPCPGAAGHHPRTPASSDLPPGVLSSTQPLSRTPTASRRCPWHAQEAPHSHDLQKQSPRLLNPLPLGPPIAADGRLHPSGSSGQKTRSGPCSFFSLTPKPSPSASLTHSKQIQNPAISHHAQYHYRGPSHPSLSPGCFSPLN